MSNLIDYAHDEINRVGLLDEHADYDGMLGKAVLELVECFAGQRHSGGSASITLAVFDKVSRRKPLSPITDDPDEWVDRTEESGVPMWQSKRDPAVFSKDGGKSWYSMDEQDSSDISDNPQDLNKDLLRELKALAGPYGAMGVAVAAASMTDVDGLIHRLSNQNQEG